MILFKDGGYGRLQKEFYGKLDGRLRAAIKDLADFADRQFLRHIVITCVNRTPEENDAIGGAKQSAHLNNRAVDIRSFDSALNKWYFSDEQQAEIKKFLEDTWGKDFIFVKTDMHGTAPHIHININYGERNTWV